MAADDGETKTAVDPDPLCTCAPGCSCVHHRKAAAKGGDERLPVIMRPNGKPYRPRVIRAMPLTDENEIPCGVIVLGTHDQLAAKPLADACARLHAGCDTVAVDPVPGWWSEAFRYGERRWEDDPEHGRGGVWFREVVEVRDRTDGA